MDTNPVTNKVTGRNRLNERFGYNNKVAHDIKSKLSLNILCNMVAPFSPKNKNLMICNMHSFSRITKYNNVFWKSFCCFTRKFRMNLAADDFCPIKENFVMINEEEKLIFLKELGRLIEDYKRCCDDEYQEQIYEDIMHLINVIN